MATNTSNLRQIPVIDISGNVHEDIVGQQLIEAARDQGFVYVKTTGSDIPVNDIDAAFAISKKLFALSHEEKQSCAITEDNKGWSSMHSETLDAKTQRVGDFKEAFNFGEFVNGRAQQNLPSTLAPDEAVISRFFDQCHDMCLKLLKLFAIGLRIDDTDGGSEWFSSRHARNLGPSGTTLRFLFYPALSEDNDYNPEIDIRAGAHSDYGSITLLYRMAGQPGLEILSGEEWIPVPVTPKGTESDPSPPILVNIGDLLSYWTNGVLKSTVHRVVFPKDARKGGDDRYSIAFFCHPHGKVQLEQVPSELVKAGGLNVQNGKANGTESTMTAEEHLHQRLKASYLTLKWDEIGESS